MKTGVFSNRLLLFKQPSKKMCLVRRKIKQSSQIFLSAIFCRELLLNKKDPVFIVHLLPSRIIRITLPVVNKVLETFYRNSKKTTSSAKSCILLHVDLFLTVVTSYRIVLGYTVLCTKPKQRLLSGAIS